MLLLGSVLIPAAMTWHVRALLRDNREVVEPARHVQSQLELGLAEEAAAIRDHVLTGDSARLALYRATARADDRRLAELARLGSLLDGRAVARVELVERRMRDWRHLNATLLGATSANTAFAETTQAWRAAHDSASRAFDELAAHLRAESVERQEEVRASETLSLVANASLVLAALAAVFSVAGLIRREQRLTSALERRIEAEVALRNAAQALAAAYSLDDVTDAITRSALGATQARGVFVEQFVPGTDTAPDVVIVRASAGSGAPETGSTAPYAGSYAEAVVRRGEAVFVASLAHVSNLLSHTAGTDADSSALVIPVGDAHGPIGALFILAQTGAHLDTDAMARARTFGHLAALAYEKVWLLNAARNGREELERVMKSRSGLMRGFSHDVKNPLGAADGYADLLSSDVYGPLSAAQKDIIGRIRRSIRGALALIDQINTLARAETGHLELVREPVDLGELVRSISEEYHAEARNCGLNLSVDLSAVPPIVVSDPGRARQIVGNLVSNAIKYTSTGSVVLRTRQSATGPVAGSGPSVAVEVTDTGPGIPAEKQSLLFEEFVRLGGSDAPGTGLGLAISRRLAHALHGEITVESQPGQGSTFALWLPLPSQEDHPTPTSGEKVEGDPRADPSVLPITRAVAPAFV